MKITLYNIGRTDVPYLKEGIDDYYKRINHFLDFSIIDLPLVKHGKTMTPEMIRQKEGEIICQAVRKISMIILLDENGKEHSSRSFSEWIDKLTEQGVKQLAFITGGAYGFSKEVYALANNKMSLSKMTFTHQMVRLIFAEQLYRALTLVRGIPYHND